VLGLEKSFSGGDALCEKSLVIGRAGRRKRETNNIGCDHNAWGGGGVPIGGECSGEIKKQKAAIRIQTKEKCSISKKRDVSRSGKKSQFIGQVRGAVFKARRYGKVSVN